MSRVSIIIAAYNIEKYIERCLSSVINQTFEDIEIIVVNDGSTDNTLDIIKKISRNDSRVKIINKQNEGLIEARKSGFKASSGEYILFIDGDDWIKENCIEVLYNHVKNNKYDIVQFQYIMKYDNKEKKGWKFEYKNLKGYDLLELCLLGKVSHNIWSKFIKRDFIIKNNVEFPSDISYGEDLALVCSISMNKPTVHVIDDYLYYYYQREDSLSNEINTKILEIYTVTEFIKVLLKKHNLFNKYRKEFEFLAYIQNYHVRRNYMFNKRSTLGKLLFKNWKNLNINISNNDYYIELFSKESNKVKLVNKLFLKSYNFAILYYKLKS